MSWLSLADGCCHLQYTSGAEMRRLASLPPRGQTAGVKRRPDAMHRCILPRTYILIVGHRAATPLATSWAQLHPADPTGIIMGQLHYYVRNVDADRKFWLAFGGTPGRKL